MASLGFVLYALAVAFAVAGCVYKGLELRRRSANPALHSIFWLLVFLAASVGIGWPPVQVAVNSALHSPGISDLLSRSSAVVASVFAQSLMLHLDSATPGQARRRIARRWWLAALVLPTMIACYLAARVAAPSPEPFLSTAAGGVYIGLVMSYQVLADLDVLRLSLRYVRTAARPMLRFGIWMLVLASATNVLYAANEILSFVMRAAGQPRPPSIVWDGVFTVICTVGLVAAAVVPSLGPILLEAVRWPRRWRRYRQLHPLWLAAYRAVPQIALEPRPDPGRDRLVVRGMYRALYRRVIEIHDALLHVAPYAGAVGSFAAERARAAGADPPHIRAVADAAMFAVGVRELEGAHPPIEAPRHDGLHTADETNDGVDLDADVEHLTAVAWALEHSDEVRAVLASYTAGELRLLPRPPQHTTGGRQQP